MVVSLPGISSQYIHFTKGNAHQANMVGALPGFFSEYILSRWETSTQQIWLGRSQDFPLNFILFTIGNAHSTNMVWSLPGFSPKHILHSGNAHPTKWLGHSL
jgi:hypothetical protein